MASTSRRRGAGHGRDTGGHIHRERKYYKLIHQVELEPTTPNIQLVVDFLSKEQWFHPLEHFVDALDASRIPPVPFQNIAAITTIDEADTAIAGNVTLFRCLLHSTRTPQVEAYIKHAFDLLLERWASIIKWMAFIVMHCAISIDPKKVLQHCTDALHAILSRASESPAKQEMVAMTGTADLVYLLFCQTDKTGKYYIMRSSEDPHEHCILTELFCIYFMESAEGWEAMQSRLKAVGKDTREQILKALSGRAKALADDAEESNVSGYAASFNYLARGILTMGSDEQVWAHLSQAQVHAKLASALVRLMEKAYGGDQECWDDLSNTTLCIAASAITFAPNPTKMAVSLVEGGLFRAAMRCLPHLGNTRGAYQTLELIVPHMYLQKALMAAKARGDLEEILNSYAPPENLTNPKAVNMWKLVNLEVRRAHGAHCGGVDVSPLGLCSSTKHFKRHSRTAEDLKLKTCSHCHWVTYCSPECQRDDWTDYHWLECRMAATRGHTQFLEKSKNIIEIRRSQIACLEYAVNEPGYMSSYHTLLPSSPLPHAPAPRPYDAFDDPRTCSVLKIPLGVPTRNSRPIPIINFATKCVPLSPKLDPTMQRIVVPEFKDDHANEWEQRYRGFVRDVETQRVGQSADERKDSAGLGERVDGSSNGEEPSDGELRLVEGHFWYVDTVAMRTLVKVQYRRGRWRVIGSLFRLVLNKIEAG